MKIAFGALVDPLCVQLGLSPVTVENEQADANAIARLTVRSLLSHGEAQKARARLLKRIEAVMRSERERGRP